MPRTCASGRALPEASAGQQTLEISRRQVMSPSGVSALVAQFRVALRLFFRPLPSLLEQLEVVDLVDDRRMPCGCSEKFRGQTPTRLDECWYWFDYGHAWLPDRAMTPKGSRPHNRTNRTASLPTSLGIPEISSRRTPSCPRRSPRSR